MTDLSHNQRAVLIRISKKPAGIRQINTWPMPAQWAVEYLLSHGLVAGKVRRLTESGKEVLSHTTESK